MTMSVLRKITGQIRPYMDENGYTFSQNYFYKIHNDIAYGLELEMPSELVYATFFVIPLYIPCKNRYFTYGNRVSKPMPLSKNASENELEAWCGLLRKYLEKDIFPFFEKIDSPGKLAKQIEKKKYAALLACNPVQIARLQLFSYLYAEDFDSLHSLIRKYPQLVQESAFLTERVRNIYLEEKDTVDQLTQQDVETVRTFCAKTIEETIRNCFG
jgi:hypothetical protein